MELSVAVILGIALSAALLAVLLLALYWVVRLAVRHGIQDARPADELAALAEQPAAVV